MGDGPEFESLKHLSTTLGLDDVVTFTGYQTGDALLTAYSSFDIGVIPDPKDVYNDKITMNKTLEFMALGIPFAQFALDQTSLDAGDASVKATANTPEALAEAILKIADNPDLRTRMKEAAQQRTAALSWPEAKGNLLKAYAKAFE